MSRPQRVRLAGWMKPFIARARKVAIKMNNDLIAPQYRLVVHTRLYNKTQLLVNISIVNADGMPLIANENVCKGKKEEYSKAESPAHLQDLLNKKIAENLTKNMGLKEAENLAAVHPNTHYHQYTPERFVGLSFIIERNKDGTYLSTGKGTCVGCWSCGGSRLISPISKNHLGTLLYLAYALICGIKSVTSVVRGDLTNASGGNYYERFGWVQVDDEEMYLLFPGTRGLEKTIDTMMTSNEKYGPGEYLRVPEGGISESDRLKDLKKKLDGLKIWAESNALIFGGRRKTKKRKRTKRRRRKKIKTKRKRKKR